MTFVEFQRILQPTPFLESTIEIVRVAVTKIWYSFMNVTGDKEEYVINKADDLYDLFFIVIKH